MKDHSGTKRRFHQFSKAWYCRQNEAERFMIGMYHDDGSTSGEFSVTWENVGDGKLTPKLCAYDDSWSALNQFQDLLSAMADLDSKNISPSKLREILLSLWIEDATNTERR